MSAAGQMQTSALRLFWWVGAPGTSMAYGNASDNPAALSLATADMLRGSGRPWCQVNGSAKHGNDMPYSLVAVRCPDPAMALEFRQSV